MKKNALIAALRVAVILFSLASAASAQVTTATIVGTITDSSGAALPGATVTARNVDTGFTRTVPSNEDGAYRLEFLPIGSYVVEVTPLRVQDGHPQRHRPERQRHGPRGRRPCRSAGSPRR